MTVTLSSPRSSAISTRGRLPTISTKLSSKRSPRASNATPTSNTSQPRSFGEDLTGYELDRKYRATFVANLERAVAEKLLDERMSERFDLQNLAEYLELDRDDHFEYMAMETNPPLRKEVADSPTTRSFPSTVSGFTSTRPTG